MKHWLITGKIQDDDEIFASVYEADTRREAEADFVLDTACLLTDPDRTDLIEIHTVAWSDSTIYVETP